MAFGGWGWEVGERPAARSLPAGVVVVTGGEVRVPWLLDLGAPMAAGLRREGGGWRNRQAVGGGVWVGEAAERELPGRWLPAAGLGPRRGRHAGEGRGRQGCAGGG